MTENKLLEHASSGVGCSPEEGNRVERGFLGPTRAPKFLLCYSLTSKCCCSVSLAQTFYPSCAPRAHAERATLGPKTFRTPRGPTYPANLPALLVCRTL